MLKFIKDRVNDYNIIYFVNELTNASKKLGILEAKIDSYQFNSILIPMLLKKEAVSSMFIEGTQTTISEVLKNEINPQPSDEKIRLKSETTCRHLFMEQTTSDGEIHSLLHETNPSIHDDRYNIT